MGKYVAVGDCSTTGASKLRRILPSARTGAIDSDRPMVSTREQSTSLVLETGNNVLFAVADSLVIL